MEDVLLTAAAKYCRKAPDAEEAAKKGPKLEKKVNKVGEKFDKKVEKFDCATEADPGNAVTPIGMPIFDPGEGEAFLLSWDPLCDGA